MNFSPSTIAALVIAASFAAGLNVYATVLTLGVLSRLHWAVLPGGLEMLGDWWVIGASAALFAAEFVADKSRVSIWCGMRCTPSCASRWRRCWPMARQRICRRPCSCWR